MYLYMYKHYTNINLYIFVIYFIMNILHTYKIYPYILEHWDW